MSVTPSRRPLLVGAALLALGLVGAAVAWLAWPEPPPPEPEAVEDGDTGLTREQTEEMMRTIGYVQ